MKVDYKCKLKELAIEIKDSFTVEDSMEDEDVKTNVFVMLYVKLYDMGIAGETEYMHEDDFEVFEYNMSK